MHIYLYSYLSSYVLVCMWIKFHQMTIFKFNEVVFYRTFLTSMFNADLRGSILN